MRFSVVVFLLSILLPPLAAFDWPTFRGDDANSGIAPPGFPAQPEILWVFEPDEQDQVEGTAAIVGDTVYITTLRGKLFALDFKTGKERWYYKASDEIKSSPTVHNGVVYIGDEMGVFHAVDAKTGALKWKFQTEGGVISSPKFIGENLYFGSYDAFFYALKIEDGSKQWSVETDGYIHGTPGVYKDELIIAGCDAFLRGLKPDGKERFNTTAGGYVAGSPLIAGDMAYFGNFENQVLAVDLIKGEPVWAYEHEIRKFPYYSSPALVDGRLLIGGRDKMMRALNAETGVELWTFRTRGKIDASPVVSGDLVIFGDTAGKLFILNHADGKKVWEYDTGSGVIASPAIADNKMVIGTDSGQVFCFGAK